MCARCLLSIVSQDRLSNGLGIVLCDFSCTNQMFASRITSSQLFDYARAADGERRNAREPFEKDPYGCSHSVLVRACVRACMRASVGLRTQLGLAA